MADETMTDTDRRKGPKHKKRFQQYMLEYREDDASPYQRNTQQQGIYLAAQPRYDNFTGNANGGVRFYASQQGPSYPNPNKVLNGPQPVFLGQFKQKV